MRPSLDISITVSGLVKEKTLIGPRPVNTSYSNERLKQAMPLVPTDTLATEYSIDHDSVCVCVCVCVTWHGMASA